jgi:hypothetical protein
VVDHSLPLGACNSGIIGLKSSQEQRLCLQRSLESQKWVNIGPQATLKKNEKEKKEEVEEAEEKKKENNLLQAMKQRLLL